MTELRVHVERAVRPVRASNRRKDRMREELLAHLTGVFEQELERLGDEQEALREAVRRFGPAKELTRELQATVPWLERRLFMPLPLLGAVERRLWPREGESPGRHALRVAVAITVAMAAIQTSAMAFLAMFGTRPLALGRLLVFACGATGLFVGGNAFCFALLGHAMRQALCEGTSGPRSWRRAVACGVAASVVGTISALGVARLVNWQARAAVFTWGHWPVLIAFALATPLGLVLTTILSAPDIRRREQWGRLCIDK